MKYIANWNFGLDIKILIKTVASVLGMKGRCEWKTGSGESYEILDNKTKVILGTKDKGQKPFTAILCFASDSDMNEYVKENPDCYENILSKAKFPQDYLE